MSNDSQPGARRESWREHWYEIIFEADTPSGKLFDVLLLAAILISVLVVVLESVDDIHQNYRSPIFAAEWLFTVLFTLEYAARIACAQRPLRYVISFYGIVDLLAIVPTYLMVLLPGAQSFAVIRALRLLRAFRVFKLAHMLSEASALRRAVWASRAKILVFLTFVLIIVVIVGAAMHLIEGEPSGFTSIPESMYWAIVTMTTVGYGDVAPQTPLGKTMAGLMMVLGYSLIIIPTGIVTTEIAQAGHQAPSTQVCPECMAEGHDTDAAHCKFCGGQL